MITLSHEPDPESHKLQHFPDACLLVVASPIGNLSDLSPRAVQALCHASLIACEDARVSRKLFDALGIRPDTVSIEQHRETQALPKILAHLTAGKRCALLSDAGTPAISDPGFRVVAAVREAGFVVLPIPGPSAFVALASVSGFHAGPIWFEGFLPQREQAAALRLSALLALRAHLAIYEAPHRITKTAKLLAKLAPSRKLCVGRELTKRFEESVVLTAQDLPKWLESTSHRERGEFSLLIASDHKPSSSSEDLQVDRDDEVQAPTKTEACYNIEGRALLEALLTATAPAQAARLAQRLTKDRKTDWYQMAVTLRANREEPAQK